MLRVNKILTILMLFITVNSYAFVLNGTRYIYPESNNSISMTVRNNAAVLYGGQVWIENHSSVDDRVYFSVSPSLFRLNGGESQLVRIFNVDDSLPKNRESLFYINAQEIPRLKESGESNEMMFAINTKVKLIYRPDAVKSKREDAEQNIKITHVGNTTRLHNDTPYFFAIIEAYDETDKAIDINKYGLRDPLGTFAPGSSVDIPRKHSKLSIVSIGDYGETKKYTLEVKE